MENLKLEKNEIRFCPFCGTRLDLAARFCKNCGKSIEQTSQSISPNANSEDFENKIFMNKPITERKIV